MESAVLLSKPWRTIFARYLRSRGISTVEITAVMKAGKPTLEFTGPEEHVKKAKEVLGNTKFPALSLESTGSLETPLRLQWYNYRWCSYPRVYGSAVYYA